MLRSRMVQKRAGLAAGSVRAPAAAFPRMSTQSSFPAYQPICTVPCFVASTRPARHVACSAGKREDEPDWDAEMSIFKQRISQPNQLATLRELESKANVGKVIYCEQNLAIVCGLNPDAPVGTKLSFVSGGQGVLLWHRSNNIAFVLLLGGAAAVSVGEAVECKIRGVLQVLDDAKGPITRKDFELFQSPAGDELFGHVVDFFGRTAGSQAPLGADRTRPLIREQVRRG